MFGLSRGVNQHESLVWCTTMVHPEKVVILHIHAPWWSVRGRFNRGPHYRVWAHQGDPGTHVIVYEVPKDKEILPHLLACTNWLEVAALLRPLQKELGHEHD